MKIQESLEEYRYGVLDAAETHRVETHLEACDACKAVMGRIRGIEESLLSLSEGQGPPLEKVRADAQRIVQRDSRKPRFKEMIPMAAAAVLLAGVFASLIGPSLWPRVPGSQETKGIFEEKKLGVIESDMPKDVVISPDGKTWAYPAKVGEKGMAMVIGGERGEVYRRVVRPYFSPDGQKVAYVALDADGDKVFVVTGKTRGEAFLSIGSPMPRTVSTAVTGEISFDLIPGALDWAPDSHAIAYVGRSEQGLHVVIGDKKSEPFKFVREFAWSPGGHTLAYSAESGQDNFVVVDNRKGEIFDSVGSLTFGPDGTTLAYRAYEGNRCRMIVGGKKEPPFKGVGCPVFSPDGKAVAYAARLSDTADLMTIDGEIDGRFKGIISLRLGDPVFSPNGKRLACKASSGDSEWIIVDGKDDKPERFDRVGNPIFSPDGATVAYAAMKGSKQLVVVGTQVGEKFSQVSHLTFSVDGKSMAYRAERFGKQVVVAGGAMSEEFDEVCEGPFYSSDSKRVAFVIRQGKELWSKVLQVK